MKIEQGYEKSTLEEKAAYHAGNLVTIFPGELSDVIVIAFDQGKTEAKYACHKDMSVNDLIRILSAVLNAISGRLL